VSCASSTTCTAVGFYFLNSNEGAPTATLAERWNGTSWGREVTPNASIPQVGGSSLHAVSCVSSVTCLAVGNDQDNDPIGELRLPEPSNRFTVSDVTALADGTIDFQIRCRDQGD
jgi:hypothetical protein